MSVAYCGGLRPGFEWWVGRLGLFLSGGFLHWGVRVLGSVQDSRMASPSDWVAVRALFDFSLESELVSLTGLILL